MIIRTSSGEELQSAAADFVRTLAPMPSATVVTLSGDLGAGKTTFAQGIAKALGVAEAVTSPTFVIEKVYPIRDAPHSNGAGELQSGFKRLIHIDAYRLSGAQQLEVLKWDELLKDAGNLIVLEWPEKVAEAIPEWAVALRFDIDGDGRIINIHDGQKS